MTKYHVALLLSVLLSAIAVALFKSVSMQVGGNIVSAIAEPRFYLVIMLLGVAFAFWFFAASKIDYSVLIFSHTLALVIGGLIGYVGFGESFGYHKIISYFLITTGVLVLLIGTSAGA